MRDPRRQKMYGLEQVVQKNCASRDEVFINILKKWKEILGNDYSKICSFSAYKNGILTINVKHPSFVSLMNLEKRSLLKKFREQGLVLNDLHFLHLESEEDKEESQTYKEFVDEEIKQIPFESTQFYQYLKKKQKS